MTSIPSEDAIYAALNSKAVTEAARDLVTSLRIGIEVHEQITETAKYKRRGRKLQEFEQALGAFLADLLRAAGDKDAQGWVFRSMKTESFSSEPVSYATFMRIVRALTGVQFVQQVKGAPWWDKVEFDAEEVTYFNRGGTASRFRATSPLLNLAKSRGITPRNVDDHFLQELPRHPLVLKTASRTIKGRKIDSRPMRYTASPHTERLEADLKRLNAFLDRFTLGNGCHRGYLRVFNLGDASGFAWNRGGRLYSQGSPSYQRLKEHQRVLMTIDGEPVVEIDIKASYLTVLHGLMGLPFDPSQDPYEVHGLPAYEVDGKDIRRWVVKQWAVATLGHHSHHTRWPEKIANDFLKVTSQEQRTIGQVYPIKKVREAMMAKHPILEQWGSLDLSWADLMFVESEAVVTTMFELMDRHAAPSFSVHDSLIVRKRDLEIAQEILTRNYEDHCGIRPALEINDSAIVEEQLQAA